MLDIAKLMYREHVHALHGFVYTMRQIIESADKITSFSLPRMFVIVFKRIRVSDGLDDTYLFTDLQK